MGITFAETLAILDPARNTRFVEPGKTLAAQSSELKPTIVISGWACHQTVSESGHRQIISFVIPGDILGMHEAGLHTAYADLVTLTPTVLLQAGALFDAVFRSPAYAHLRHKFEKISSQRTEYLYRHIERLGGDSSPDRLLSLLVELHDRLTKAGLQVNGTVPFPLTQEILADSLGISAVHANRSLQQLRRNGAVDITARRLAIGALAEPCAGNPESMLLPFARPADRRAFSKATEGANDLGPPGRWSNPRF